MGCKWSGGVLTVLVAISMVTSSAVGSGEQNDAGTGSDAPDVWNDAVGVTGNFSGVLEREGGDDADWYRYPLTAGKGIRITLTPREGDLDLSLRNDDGHYLVSSRNAGTTPDAVRVVSREDTFVRIEVDSGGGSGAYDVTFERVGTPDLRISSIEVGPGLLDGSVADGGTSTKRSVSVTFENIGDSVAHWYDFVAWVSHPGQSDVSPARHNRILKADYSVADPVPPGESRTLDLSWDTLGEIGDADVNAWIYTPLDMWRGDNRASVRAHVVAGGGGIGADALNTDVCPPHGICGTARAGTNYENMRAYSGGESYDVTGFYGSAYVCDPIGCVRSSTLVAEGEGIQGAAAVAESSSPVGYQRIYAGAVDSPAFTGAGVQLWTSAARTYVVLAEDDEGRANAWVCPYAMGTGSCIGGRVPLPEEARHPLTGP